MTRRSSSGQASLLSNPASLHRMRGNFERDAIDFVGRSANKNLYGISTRRNGDPVQVVSRHRPDHQPRAAHDGDGAVEHAAKRTALTAAPDPDLDADRSEAIGSCSYSDTALGIDGLDFARTPIRIRTVDRRIEQRDLRVLRVRLHIQDPNHISYTSC